MSVPQLQLIIHPVVDGAFRYLPLAPSQPGAVPRYQLAFEARIKNTGTSAVTATRLDVVFPGSSGIPAKSIALRAWPAAGSALGPVGVAIGPGQTAAPQDFKQTDTILLAAPPPSSLEFRVFAQGHTDPARFTMPLAAATNAAAPSGFRCFARPHDLLRGEYWAGASTLHCCGHQLYAHDLGVQGFNPGTQSWSDLRPGTDGSRNTDFRIWGKPIYAMASGSVVSFLNDVPNNPQPGALVDGAHTYGNHFVLRHGGDRIVYAHMQAGSLNAALLRPGTFVSEGQFLGLAGNSGNSSAPHLHLHCVGDALQMLRPLPMRDIVVAEEAVSRPGQQQWVSAHNQGLPPVISLLYPSAVPPADDTEWSNWNSLGGQLIGGPAACSRGAQRLDVFVVGTDRALYHKRWNGSAWSSWEGQGGALTSKPSAVAWDGERIDVFGRGTDNALYHKWWNGSQWSGWEGLGGALLHAPATCSRRPHHLDVFGVGTDHALYHRIWNGSHWTAWESLGGSLAGDLDAVCWSETRIDVFGRGTDGRVHHKWWNGSAWSAWENQGQATQFGPAVSSRGANRLDLFAVGPDNTLYHRLWSGSAWSRWETLGGFLTAEPAAVSWASDRIDVFARGTDGALYHSAWAPK